MMPAGRKGERLVVHLMRDIEARKKLENLTKEIAVHVGQLTDREADELLYPAQPPFPQSNSQRRSAVFSGVFPLAGTPRRLPASCTLAPSRCATMFIIFCTSWARTPVLEAVMRAARERLI